MDFDRYTQIDDLHERRAAMIPDLEASGDPDLGDVAQFFQALNGDDELGAVYGTRPA